MVSIDTSCSLTQMNSFDSGIKQYTHPAIEKHLVLRAERRYAESERMGRAAIAAMEKLFAPGDPRLSRALSHRARLLAETKRPEEAAALLERVRSAGQSLPRWQDSACRITEVLGRFQ